MDYNVPTYTMIMAIDDRLGYKMIILLVISYNYLVIIIDLFHFIYHKSKLKGFIILIACIKNLLKINDYPHFINGSTIS